MIRESTSSFPTFSRSPIRPPHACRASDSLYRTPLYLLLSQGPAAEFAVRLRYNSTGAGDRSTLDLNALQIREEASSSSSAAGSWSGGWTTPSPTTSGR